MEELQALFVKTAGIADVVESSVKKFSDKIAVAFIYGSIARGEEQVTVNRGLIPLISHYDPLKQVIKNSARGH